HDAELAGKLAAVRAHGRELDAAPNDARAAGFDIAPETGLVARAVARRHDGLADGPADHRLARVAEDALGGLVEGEDAPAVVGGDDRVERGLENSALVRIILGSGGRLSGAIAGRH